MRCFIFALRGIAAVYKRERNLRIHSAAAYFAISAGVICDISYGEWLAVIICVGLVTAAELFNTAVEAVCDAVTRDFSCEIRLAKDAAAAGVLLSAAASFAVGLAVFLKNDNFRSGIEQFKEHPWLWACLILSVAIFIKIIFFTWREKHDK